MPIQQQNTHKRHTYRAKQAILMSCIEWEVFELVNETDKEDIQQWRSQQQRQQRQQDKHINTTTKTTQQSPKTTRNEHRYSPLSSCVSREAKEWVNKSKWARDTTNNKRFTPTRWLQAKKGHKTIKTSNERQTKGNTGTYHDAWQVYAKRSKRNEWEDVENDDLHGETPWRWDEKRKSELHEAPKIQSVTPVGFLHNSTRGVRIRTLWCQLRARKNFDHVISIRVIHVTAATRRDPSPT